MQGGRWAPRARFLARQPASVGRCALPGALPGVGRGQVESGLPARPGPQVRSAGAASTKDLVPAPNLDKHVFCRVLEDRGHVTVDEEG